MKKRLLSGLLCVGIMTTLLPAPALAAEDGGVELGGTSLTADTYYILSAGALSEGTTENYDIYYHDSTVTLDGAQLTTKLTVPDGTTIELNGDNTSGSESAPLSTCIESEGAITINGTGSLTAYGGTYAIEAKGGISITGSAEVTATATTGALYAENGSILINSTKTLHASNIYSQNMIWSAIKAGTGITIKSNVTLNGTIGLSTATGDIMIENCTVESDTSAKGLHASEGDVNISNANVTLVNTHDSSNAKSQSSIDNSGHNVSIADSTVVISGFGFGFNGNVTLKDTLLTVTPTNSATHSTPTLNYSEDFKYAVIGKDRDDRQYNITNSSDYNRYFSTRTAHFFQIRHPQQNTVAFDLNDGTPAAGADYSSQTVWDGERIKIPKSPIRNGYILNRWYDATTQAQAWGWTDGYSQTTFMPTCDVNFEAEWTKVCTITTSVIGEGGTITPTKEIDPTDVWAQTTTIKIVPNPGFKIRDVKVDGISKGSVEEIIFTTDDYSKDHTVTAEFELITYTLTVVNGDTTTTSTVGYGEQTAPDVPAPATEGSVFTGWKVNETDTVYYAGQTFMMTDDTTLTAQWSPVEDWTKPENTKLDVKVDVDIDVTVTAGAQAAVPDKDKETLLADARVMLGTALSGETPKGMTAEKAEELRTLLNSGAPKTEVELIVGVALQGALSEEQKAVLGTEMAADEAAQVWDLTVQLSVTKKDDSDAMIGTTETFPVTETSPITFTLTTGQDFTNKDVRVLYIHDSAVETAVSSAAPNGVVTVEASEFSPYVILSRAKAPVPDSGNNGGSSSSDRDKDDSYPVTIADKAPAGGTVKTSHTSAEKGDRVTITAAPAQGYELDELSITDKDGKALSVTDLGDGRYTFTMPGGKVTVAASFRSLDQTHGWQDCPKDETCPIASFTDAQPAAWYHDGVHYCLDEGLMVGYVDGTFRPDADTSRAMAAAMLWRMSGSPAVDGALSFSDVKDGDWCAPAVRWAVREGIMQGYGDGRFGADDPVTREQIVAVLFRYAQYKGVETGRTGDLSSYPDAAEVAEYAQPAVQWACGSGILSGKTQGNAVVLAPRDSASRAQMASVLMRFCTEILK